MRTLLALALVVPAALAAPTVKDINAALQRNEIAEAVRLAEAVTKAQPNNGQAWFLLGYSLHAQGAFDRAVAAHEKAATFPAVAPVALYNLACARARTGAKDGAFEALARARKAGFTPTPQNRRDPDLASLREDARFDALLPPAGAHLPKGDARQFDFWVGHWDATVRALGAGGKWADNGTLRLRIERVLGGHGIVEYTAGTMGGARTYGFSLRVFDPRENVWNLLLLWPQPNKPVFFTMQGGFRHGRGEFLAGKTRFTFSDIAADRFRWDQAQSNGKGAWTTSMMFLGTRRAAPKGDAAPAAADTSLCPGPAFRAFDFLVGEWGAFAGRSILGGAAVVTTGADEFAIHAFDSARKVWVRYELRRDDPTFTRFEGTPDAIGNATERVRWIERDPKRVTRIRERREAGTWKPIARDAFERK